MGRFTNEEMKQMDLLVDELTKDQPDLFKIKQSMKSLGLEYSEDPVERLNTVLMSLHPLVEEKDSREIDA